MSLSTTNKAKKLKEKLNDLKQESQILPLNSVVMKRDEFELLKRQFEILGEENQTKQIEIETLLRSIQDYKKREQNLMNVNEKLKQVGERVIVEQKTDDQAIENLNAEKRDLELDLYKERLKTKKLQENVEQIVMEKKLLQNRFSSALIKNIQIFKELREKQNEIKLENDRLKRVLGVLKSDASSAQYIL
jgi:DNA repair exonuclease SbcCD ATPase subunit